MIDEPTAARAAAPADAGADRCAVDPGRVVEYSGSRTGRGPGDRADEDDFAASFDRLGQVGYRVAYRILGSRDEAEDVAQETLIRAFTRWRKIHGYAEPWVARTAGNLAIDAWRHRAARPRRGDLATVDAHGASAARLDLQRLLADLPKRQRQVLVLRYVADQTETATAKALGCSVGTVKRHAHRALAALRARLDEDPPVEVNDVRESR